MADTKISALTALATTPASGDLFAIVDVSDPTQAASGTTKKITAANALAGKADTGAVTTSGLTMATARLLGRTTASTGAIEELTIGAGLTAASGSLSATNYRVIAQTSTLLTIVSTNAKTTLYSVTIPGGVITTDKCVELVINGEYFNNSGSARNLDVEITYGSTVMYADQDASIAASTLRRPYEIGVRIIGVTATTQKMLGWYVMGNSTAASTGTGDINTNSLTDTILRGTASETATGDLTLTVSITHSVSDANLEITRDYAIINAR